ncbi:unnamed protein product [Cuscuta campestris]|uniref:Uncharacterized protein n=1 Tax=Cuscuta campestris TaxID=132261 RepID=A0A484NPE0_9ASTE|nr:unnamed protein product [Cuscuta campestris]
MAMMKEIDIARNKLLIYEHEHVYDPVSGRPLTGAWIWDSALFLSEWLISSPARRASFDFAGKTVIELGAGAGLPGMAAAAVLGARRVVLTDVEALVPGLKKNVEANGLGDRVEVSRLVWGSGEWPSRLAWLEAAADVVLMSDVMYDAEAMEGLAETVKKVCREGTKVWAATEVRAYTGDCLAELEKAGFGILQLPSQLGEGLPHRFDEFVIFELIPPTRKES